MSLVDCLLLYLSLSLSPLASLPPFLSLRLPPMLCAIEINPDSSIKPHHRPPPLPRSEGPPALMSLTPSLTMNLTRFGTLYAMLNLQPWPRHPWPLKVNPVSQPQHHHAQPNKASPPSLFPFSLQHPCTTPFQLLIEIFIDIPIFGQLLCFFVLFLVRGSVGNSFFVTYLISKKY